MRTLVDQAKLRVRVAPPARPGTISPKGAAPLEVESLSRQFDLVANTLKGQTVSHGRPVQQGVLPFIVAVLVNNSDPVFSRQVCAGSLITPKWILTAAHCLDYVKPADLQIYAGSVSLDNGAVLPIPVRAFFKSPAYLPGSQQLIAPPADVALIQLENPLALGTASVPNAASGGLGNTAADIAGWGYTEEKVKSVQLRSAPVTIAEDAACSAFGHGITPETMLCAGKTSDTCKYDSGGPLFTQAGFVYTIVGVTSWAQPNEDCTQLNQYGVYTRVAAFAGWIAATIRN